MRSVVLLLAIGLFGAESALAGPCKPQASTMEVRVSTTIYPTTQSTSATGELPTAASSDTLTETIATTIASDTTAAIITISSENEATPTADVTTTAPLATPTFTIVGGGGSVNGAPLKGTDQEGSILLFNPAMGNLRARTFVLDADTGRIRDKDTGIAVCANYGDAQSSSDPAKIAFCQAGNTGPNRYYDYLTCRIINGKLACTAPKASCPEDDNGDAVCSTDLSGGVNSEFYYQNRAGAGDYLYISSGSLGGYTSVDIIAQDA